MRFFQHSILALFILAGCSQDTQPDISMNSNINNTNKEWQIYVNKPGGYSIKYPPSFHIENEHNLVNYNIEDPRYELGNPDGIKIQLQTYQLSQQNESGEIENTIRKLDDPSELAINDVTAAKAEQVKIGSDIVIAHKLLDSPGGAMMIYIALEKEYDAGYRILVFEPGYSKNKDLIEKIVSTFKILKKDNQKLDPLSRKFIPID